MLARVALIALLGSDAFSQPAADAMRLIAAGDLAGAERLLSAAAAASPGDAEVRFRLGALLLRQHKPAAALTHLETAAKLSPAVPAVWLALAHARLENTKLGEARAAAATARKLSADPRLASALAALHSNLAAAARKSGNPALAAESWQDAIALAPGDPAAYLELAALFLDHRTPPPAVAVLTAALARFPENAAVLRQLGLAHYAAGETAQAIDTFLRLMDAAPADEASYSTIETLLPNAAEKLPAITARLRRFVAAAPSSPVGHFLLAQAIEVTEPESPEIEKLLTEATRAEPKFWPAIYALHKPLAARKDWQAAAAMLQRTVALNAGYAPARYALAQVYAALGDRAKAAAERRAHHDLVTKERAAAEARNAAMPRLPYKLNP